MNFQFLRLIEVEIHIFTYSAIIHKLINSGRTASGRHYIVKLYIYCYIFKLNVYVKNAQSDFFVVA